MGKSVKIIVTGHKGGKEEMFVDIDDSLTIGQLKKDLAGHMNISASRIVITHRSKHCRDDTAVMAYCGKNDVPLHASIAKFVGFNRK